MAILYLGVLAALASSALAQPGCPVPVTCPAGYTGRYCDIVICDSKGAAPTRPPTKYGYAIDMQPFDKCSTTVELPIDNAVGVLTVEVDGLDASAKPTITVYGPGGSVVPPTANVTNNGKTLVYGWTAPPPGIYRASITASTRCLYKAIAQTKLSLSLGFTYGNRAMFSDTPSQTLNEFAVANMVTHVHNLPQPGYARTIEVYNQAGIVQGYDFKYRYGCAYEQYAGPVVCDSANVYYFKVHGIDDYGFRFMRSREFQCTPGSSTTSSPMTTPTPACMHGGVLDPTTGKCTCELGVWTGDKCQTAVCYNGGTPAGSTCKCAPYFGGFHCLEAQCLNRNPALPSDLQKTVAILVQATKTMTPDIKALQDYALELMERFAQNNPAFVYQYVVATFDEKEVKVLAKSKDPFVVAQHIWAIKPSSSVACNMKINQALVATLPFAQQYSYTFVLTDGAVDLSDTSASLSAIDMLEKSKNKVHFFYTPNAGMACANYSSDGVQRMVNLAEFSGGQMFYTASKKNTFELLHFPATVFKSGRAIDKKIFDCNARAIREYVPVDEFTSAFTVTVHGNQPSVVAFDPSNTPYSTAPVIDDQILSSRRVLSPCPQDWVLIDDTCFLPIFDRQSWNYASVDCRIKGGVLNQILNPERQRLLEFEANGIDYWTGLNDIKSYTVYVWDSVNDPPIPGNMHYTNWAPGQPADPDKNKRCVAVKHLSNGTAQWYAQECGTKMSYICERHALDFESDKLQSGLWAVEFQTHGKDGDWGKSCQVQIDVQSDVQVYAGYTYGASGLHNDKVFPEPSSKQKDNRFAASVKGLDSFSRVEQVSFYDSGFGDLIGAQHLHFRGNCTYDWISDPFTCPKSGFGTLVSGHDGKGNLFQRYSYGVCLGNALRGFPEMAQ